MTVIYCYRILSGCAVFFTINEALCTKSWYTIALRGELPTPSREFTDLLTPLSRFLLEKLTGLQLVQIFPEFMELEGSLPHSQVPITRIYPEPARSSPYPPIPLPEDPSYYYPPICALVSSLSFSPGFPIKIFYTLLPFPVVKLH
jgi:hypothetical protein